MKTPNDFPRLRLAVLPTPVYRLENLSARLGRNIYIKRDDLTGVALGGNKVRKLEFLLADARRQGARVVLTTGGAQSITPCSPPPAPCGWGWNLSWY